MAGRIRSRRECHSIELAMHSYRYWIRCRAIGQLDHPHLAGVVPDLVWGHERLSVRGRRQWRQFRVSAEGNLDGGSCTTGVVDVTDIRERQQPNHYLHE